MAPTNAAAATSFPRGSGSSGSAVPGVKPVISKKKKAEQQAKNDEDVLFSQVKKKREQVKEEKEAEAIRAAKKLRRLGGAGAVERKRKKKTETEKAAIVAEKGVALKLVGAERAAPKVPFLTITKIYEGLHTLGAVVEVKKNRVVMCIPNHMLCTLPLEEISLPFEAIAQAAENNESIALPNLRSMFNVGDVLPCVVTKCIEQKNNKSEIIVSIRPDRLNRRIVVEDLCHDRWISGSIQSVEDHGYIVDFGTKLFSGFLHKSAASFSQEPVVGQPVSGLVKKFDNARNVLSFSQKALKGDAMTSLSKNEIDLCFPGLLFSVTVAAVVKRAVYFSFLEDFGGVAVPAHLPNVQGGGNNLEEQYPVGSQHEARVLYVDKHNKLIYLSLLPHIVSRKRVQFPKVSVGQVVNDAVVVAHSQIGVEVKISNVIGNIRLGEISDDDKVDAKEAFPIGSKVACRVLNMDHLEGVFSVTLRKSIVDAPLFAASDVKVGATYEGTIVSVSDKGAVVSISPNGNVRGNVPVYHLSDSQISQPTKRFTAGKKVKVRVLHVVSTPVFSIVLTMKPSLVTSELPIFKSFSDVKKGVITHGYISQIEEDHVAVKLFGKVAGIVEKNEMGLSEGESPLTVYHKGQTVRCVVTTFNKATRRLTLSFKTRETIEKAAATSEGAKDFTPGTVLSAVIAGESSSLSNSFKVTLTSSSGKQIEADLPHDHVSDIPSLVASTVAVLKSGSKVTVVVVERKGQSFIVSMKPVLVAAAKAGKIPKNTTSNGVGDEVFGFVRNVTALGGFIGFLNGATGLCLKANISDAFVQDPSEFLKIGQTVRCNVTKTENSKLTLSLAVSANPSLDDLFLKSYFLQTEFVAAASGRSFPAALPAIGDVISAQFVSKTEGGAVVSLPFGEPAAAAAADEGKKKKKGAAAAAAGSQAEWTGFVPDLQGGEALSSGSVSARVIDIDLIKGRVVLSTKDKLVASVSSKTVKKSAEQFAKVSVAEPAIAKVETIDNEYSVLSLPSKLTIFLPLVDFNASTAAKGRYHFDLDSDVERIVPSSSTSALQLVGLGGEDLETAAELKIKGRILVRRLNRLREKTKAPAAAAAAPAAQESKKKAKKEEQPQQQPKQQEQPKQEESKKARKNKKNEEQEQPAAAAAVQDAGEKRKRDDSKRVEPVNEKKKEEEKKPEEGKKKNDKAPKKNEEVKQEEKKQAQQPEEKKNEGKKQKKQK